MNYQKRMHVRNSLRLPPYFFYILLIAALGIFVTIKSEELKSIAGLTLLTADVPDSDAFRDQHLSDESIQWLKEKTEELHTELPLLLTVSMLEENFMLQYIPDEEYTEEVFGKHLQKWGQKEEPFNLLHNSYQMIWDDLVWFPVPDSTENPDATFSYSDSWMGERTYGGKRYHEGTDIMAGINESDLYPVVSMTDGVVENIGWLEKGGYRIGIRSPGGAYFYYAHLSSYDSAMEEGAEITAGQLIGWMGSTGYGPEGTDDQFDVHLHIGIYISTASTAEMSVNPYYILRYLEDSRLQYAY